MRPKARRPKAVVAGGPGGAGGLDRRTTRRPKAVVAMSGGVDSSVAAALLKDEGYEVTGVMLKLWKGEAENNNSGCCNIGAAEDARRVADVLDIPFYVLNFADHFADSVIDDFHADYASGRTPNPCVRCNQWVKFGALMDRARALGADVLATGHYARVRKQNGRYRLLRGVDMHKDQSYVLWMLDQADLRQCLFPVGELNKPQTRAIAAELGLRTAAKPDSQEICFVRGGDVGAYIAEHIPEGTQPGPIRDRDGKVVGEHRGVARYTVGQRRGLGISLGEPVFVTSIDRAENAINVGRRADLSVAELVIEETSFVQPDLLPDMEVHLQHRAHGETNLGRLHRVDRDHCSVAFGRPVDSVAPGQSAVFYDPSQPEELIGGGIIASTKPASAPSPTVAATARG
ncbi:MAG: tRNA 2-thiouridine(34) synthase MnmA [Actinomycetota bacterium]|nr:tRNA 2-thiouridine(34) synthase MnmA [Actinomycetota bacterium]